MVSHDRPGTIDDTELHDGGSRQARQHCRHRVGFDRLACAAFLDRIPRGAGRGPGFFGVVFQSCSSLVFDLSPSWASQPNTLVRIPTTMFVGSQIGRRIHFNPFHWADCDCACRD